MRLDKVEFQVKCPRCVFFNPVSIKQVRIRDTTICRGCKCTIQIDDHMNEARRVERQFEKMMKQISNLFKR